MSSAYREGWDRVFGGKPRGVSSMREDAEALRSGPKLGEGVVATVWSCMKAGVELDRGRKEVIDRMTEGQPEVVGNPFIVTFKITPELARKVRERPLRGLL